MIAIVNRLFREFGGMTCILRVADGVIKCSFVEMFFNEKRKPLLCHLADAGDGINNEEDALFQKE
jgi:hypothetical protein